MPIAIALPKASFRASLLVSVTLLGGISTLPVAGEQPITGTGFVYTANEFDNSVSRIDLATGEVETVPVPISPHNVELTADGTRLLAVGSAAEGDGHHHDQASHGTAEQTRGLLLIIDTAGFSSGTAMQIEVGEHPAHVIADPEGKHAFVTNSEDDNVSVIDLATGTVVGSIPTAGFPHGLRMSPSNSEIYVAGVENDGISVLDPATLLEIARIPAGDAPVQVSFIPDGSRAYVSLRDEDKVAVIDPVARVVIGKIDVGNGPIQVYATPDGRHVLVANQGTEAEPSDTVSVIDVAAGKVVETVRTGSGAHGVVISTDGSLAFVTNIFDGTVSVIDTATWSVAETITVGAGPNGITFSH